METNTKNWLVRSSTKILGPFDIDEIKDLLMQKKISIIDEVKQSSSRWFYIREKGEFQSLIQDIRNEQESFSEPTVAEAISRNAHLFEENTPIPIFSHPPSKSETKIKSFGSLNDPRVTAELLKNSRIKTLITVCIGLVILFSVFVIFHKSQPKISHFDLYLSRANQYLESGLYQKSYLNYQKANQIKPLSHLQVEPLLPVILTVANRSVEVRRILEVLLKNKTSVLLNLMALTFLKEDRTEFNLSKAEAYLQEALVIENNHFNAYLNLAVVYLKINSVHSVEKSISAIKKALKIKPLDPYALLIQGYLIVKFPKLVSDIDVVNYMDKVKSSIEKNVFLSKELSLIYLILAEQRNNFKEIGFSLESFYNQAPQETNKYAKNLFIDWSFADWEILNPLCQNLVSVRKNDKQVSAVKVMCLLEVGKDKEASREIKETILSDSKNEYFNLNYIYYLYKMGENQEMLSFLKKSVIERHSFSYYIQVLQCIQNEQVDCAAESSEMLRIRRPNEPLTYFSSAWTEFRKSNNIKALEYIESGLKIYPRYIPLLQLKNLMSNGEEE